VVALLTSAADHQSRANELISELSIDWPLERIALVDRLIMTLAVGEMLMENAPPVAVILTRPSRWRRLFPPTDLRHSSMVCCHRSLSEYSVARRSEMPGMGRNNVTVTNSLIVSLFHHDSWGQPLYWIVGLGIVLLLVAVMTKRVGAFNLRAMGWRSLEVVRSCGSCLAASGYLMAFCSFSRGCRSGSRTMW